MGNVHYWFCSFGNVIGLVRSLFIDLLREGLLVSTLSLVLGVLKVLHELFRGF